MATVCGAPALAMWFATTGGGNQDVLDVAYSMSRGGYCRPADTGVAEDITFKGIRILAKSRDGSTYHLGYTLTVALKAAQRRSLLDEKRPDQIKRFQREWYSASSTVGEEGLVGAMVNLGIGTEVAVQDAKPGDFINFYRPELHGQSAILLGWLRDESDTIVGFRFRTSSPTTYGIGDDLEYFSTSGRQDAVIDPKRFFVGRLN
jgi:hypothetical protein